MYTGLLRTGAMYVCECKASVGNDMHFILASAAAGGACSRSNLWLIVRHCAMHKRTWPKLNAELLIPASMIMRHGMNASLDHGRRREVPRDIPCGAIRNGRVAFSEKTGIQLAQNDILCKIAE